MIIGAQVSEMRSRRDIQELTVVRLVTDTHTGTLAVGQSKSDLAAGRKSKLFYYPRASSVHRDSQGKYNLTIRQVRHQRREPYQSLSTAMSRVIPARSPIMQLSMRHPNTNPVFQLSHTPVFGSGFSPRRTNSHVIRYPVISTERFWKIKPQRTTDTLVSAHNPTQS